MLSVRATKNRKTYPSKKNTRKSSSNENES